MEQLEPEPVVAELPVARVVEPDIDLRSRAQRACDKLPACDSSIGGGTWCDISGCDVPCEVIELVGVLDGCDVGCL